MIKLAIHQPEFLPWIGYFYKMQQADHYIVLDHVQFKKRYFENRNRIVTPGGEVCWLTVPVRSKGRYMQPINQVEIDNSVRWKNKILGRIKRNYAKSRYFKIYYEEIEAIISEYKGSQLMALNMSLIHFFRKHLGITSRLHFSSELMDKSPNQSGSNLIKYLCLSFMPCIYVSGPSGIKYLDLEDFHKIGLTVEWISFQHPTYPQLCEAFCYNLSSLDLVFNTGMKSIDFIKKSVS